MRRTMLLLAILGLAGSLWAPDPIIGKWKLNLAKSRFGVNQQGSFKDGMEVYREVSGNQIELTYTRTMADSSSLSYSRFFYTNSIRGLNRHFEGFQIPGKHSLPQSDCPGKILKNGSRPPIRIYLESSPQDLNIAL